MASTFSNVLSTEEIDLLLNTVEVNDAKLQLTSNTNKVDFTMHLSDTVKQALLDRLGLNLQNVVDVPFRWIRGDTVAHADQAKDGHHFDNTYLMYLTDSVGTLDVDGQSYPMTKGAAYVFSEGLMHGTSDADAEPRLMLGPMNNNGVRVGAVSTPTTISLDGSVSGQNTIYIRQGEEIVEFSLDQDSWYGIYWPCGIENTSTNPITSLESSFVSVIFTTDITLIDPNNYFIVLSRGIIFGNIFMQPDWTRPAITVADVSNYPGLVQCGTSSSIGHGYIFIFNLEITARGISALAEEGGWVIQAHCSSGTNEEPIWIFNCCSTAPIADNCGGIAGSNLAKVGGYAEIVGCQSTGTIGENAGGIVGIRAAEDGGSVYVAKCSSTGAIGDSAGGIAGAYCGGHSGNIDILNCYSTGEISIRGGGIVGIYCGNDGTNTNYGTIDIYRCYSNGFIGEDAGGIVGSTPGGNITVTNCMSTGAISSSSFSGGIYGRSFDFEKQSAEYCYTSGLKTGATTGGIYGGSASDVLTNSVSNYSEENNSGTGWSDSNANAILLGVPTTTLFGTHWSRPDGFDTPYKLTQTAFSPYTITFLAFDEITETIVAGTSSAASIGSGFTHQFLQINGQMSYNFPELSINANTGVISTAFSKDTRTYEIYIHSSKNPYAVTYLLLTVEGSEAKQCFANNLCVKGKKFVGGNRDASAVISARTTKVLTNLKTIDPKQKSDTINVQNRQQALTRVRAGGYMVPKKVTGKHLNQ